MRATVDEKAVVYRCYDAEDRLLYIGCTTNLPRRVLLHRSRTSWWSEVARIETDPAGGRQAMFREERRQIAQLAPLYNKTGNARRGWDYRSRRNGSERSGGLTYFPDLDEFRAHDDEPLAA